MDSPRVGPLTPIGNLLKSVSKVLFDPNGRPINETKPGASGATARPSAKAPEIGEDMQESKYSSVKSMPAGILARPILMQSEWAWKRLIASFLDSENLFLNEMSSEPPSPSSTQATDDTPSTLADPSTSPNMKSELEAVNLALTTSGIHAGIDGQDAADTFLPLWTVVGEPSAIGAPLTDLTSSSPPDGANLPALAPSVNSESNIGSPSDRQSINTKPVVDPLLEIQNLNSETVMSSLLGMQNVSHESASSVLQGVPNADIPSNEASLFQASSNRGGDPNRMNFSQITPQTTLNGNHQYETAIKTLWSMLTAASGQTGKEVWRTEVRGLNEKGPVVEFAKLNHSDFQGLLPQTVQQWVIEDRLTSCVQTDAYEQIGQGMFFLPDQTGRTERQAVRWQAKKQTRITGRGKLIHRIQFDLRVNQQPVRCILTSAKPSLLVHFDADDIHLQEHLKQGQSVMERTLIAIGWRIENWTVSTFHDRMETE